MYRQLLLGVSLTDNEKVLQREFKLTIAKKMYLQHLMVRVVINTKYIIGFFFREKQKEKSWKTEDVTDT